MMRKLQYVMMKLAALSVVVGRSSPVLSFFTLTCDATRARKGNVNVQGPASQ